LSLRIAFSERTPTTVARKLAVTKLSNFLLRIGIVILILTFAHAAKTITISTVEEIWRTLTVEEPPEQEEFDEEEATQPEQPAQSSNAPSQATRTYRELRQRFARCRPHNGL